MKYFQNSCWKRDLKNPRASVLIPFYNNFKFLKLVLAGLQRQTEKNFEIVICDDGSREDVVAQVRPYLESLDLPIQYVWHRDLGFRKNRILNHGILCSKSEFLIFVDADCVAHPAFVAEYLAYADSRVALSGRRVELSPELTEDLDEQKIREGWIENNYWRIALQLVWRKDSNSPKGFYIKTPWLRSLVNKKKRPIVGSSFAGNKADFEAINGFDLRYEGVGIGEDSDIDFRLQLSGVRLQPMTNIAIQYHLWHPYKVRPSVNEALFEKVQKEKKARTEYGLEQLKQELQSSADL